MSDTQLFAVTEAGPQPLPVSYDADTIHDLFDSLPLGVYSALRTYEGYKFLRLADHLERTEKSMALLGWEYRLDRPAFCRALHEVCLAYPYPDARVRFDVLGEEIEAAGLASRVLIALSPFVPVPERYYRRGVAVDLAPRLRRERPLVKLASFVLERRPYPLGQERAYDHLILDEQGRILEGSSSNFYAVRRGELWTAGEGVLEGVTRKIALELAAGENIPTILEAPPLDDLADFDEAFISSSSRALLPVVKVAGRQIGHGRPGPVTRRLMAAYDDLAAREIKPAVTTTA